ncbi:putative lectin family integral membrane protein [Cryomyces antarcticus]|nr:hypothetical protein LTR04_005845 [Oleoguttula sp. CCFEE 6159]
MFITPSSVWLLALSAFAASTARAQYMIESLSFGHKESISPNHRTVPGWQLSGEGHTPQLLSDRIILTPPHPGSKRGALWSETGVGWSEWTADLDFRASGPERGSGNLQIWFTKDRQAEMGLASVYTIGQFDGLVLVLDQYGGRGGSVRGFLNDGTTSYKDHHNVDSLAFGHCDYAYRNLGRPTHVRIKNGHDNFEVHVDDKPCFSSDKIRLPLGYYFGISAASAEIPDSFEVNKFVVSTTNSIAREEVRKAPPQSPPQTQEQQEKRPSLQRMQELPGITNIPEDAPAESIKSQEEQFADLHNRLQGLNHQVATIYEEFTKLSKAMEDRHKELMSKTVPSVPHDQINQMDSRIQAIARSVEAVRRDIEGRDYKEHLTSLQDALKDTKASLMDSLPQTMSQIVSTSAPKMGKFIFVVIAFQIMLAGSYIVYKRRRANAPKKYL